MPNKEVLQKATDDLMEKLKAEFDAEKARMDTTEAEAFRDRLRDWTNRDEIGSRFPVYSKVLYGLDLACPTCSSDVLLVDDWPPNYASSSGIMPYDGSPGQWRTSGSLKMICPSCETFFGMGYTKIEEGDETEITVRYEDPVALTEFEGVLLTPHDVWQEEYKKEKGEYPYEAYG
jgi:hypothetical protein